MVSERNDDDRCGDDVGECSNVIGEMGRRLVKDVVAGGEVCGSGVSVGCLLSPRLLSPGT